MSLLELAQRVIVDGSKKGLRGDDRNEKNEKNEVIPPGVVSGIDDATLEVTVANLLKLAPSELDDYRAELVAAPPNDPHLAHDREALRRVDALPMGPETA